MAWSSFSWDEATIFWNEDVNCDKEYPNDNKLFLKQINLFPNSYIHCTSDIRFGTLSCKYQLPIKFSKHYVNSCYMRCTIDYKSQKSHKISLWETKQWILKFNSMSVELKWRSSFLITLNVFPRLSSEALARSNIEKIVWSWSNPRLINMNNISMKNLLN